MEKNKKPKKDKYKKAYKRILSLSFILIILIFSVLNILTPVKTFSSEENRILSEKPKFSKDLLIEGKFTKKFEKYFSDHFIFRDFFIGVKSDGERLIGKRDINGVYIGDDGYLIEKFQEPSSERIDEIVKSFDTFYGLKKDINKSIAIVPNAVEILKDKLPKNVIDESQKEYIDKLRNSLGDKFNFIDVYKELENNKDENLYYKTDHHWTTDGAYYGYRAIMEGLGYTPRSKEEFSINKVTNDFYGTLYSKGGFRHLVGDDINVYIPNGNTDVLVNYVEEDKKATTFYDLNALNKKDKYSLFLGGNHSVVKINTPCENGKKLLIIKDSYANSLVPFFSQDFSSILMVDLRYYNGDIYEFIKQNQVNDVLFLYNANTFFQDDSIKNLIPLE